MTLANVNKVSVSNRVLTFSDDVLVDKLKVFGKHPTTNMSGLGHTEITELGKIEKIELNGFKLDATDADVKVYKKTVNGIEEIHFLPKGIVFLQTQT